MIFVFFSTNACDKKDSECEDSFTGGRHFFVLVNWEFLYPDQMKQSALGELWELLPADKEFLTVGTTTENRAEILSNFNEICVQDTKSSNGTFVNNQRLSKGSEESPPREVLVFLMINLAKVTSLKSSFKERLTVLSQVCSGDILQFGVDVMENSRKVQTFVEPHWSLP